MKNLAKLKETAKGILAFLDGLSTKIEAAEAAGKTDDLKTLKGEYDGKSKEFDALEADIAEAEAHAKRHDAFNRLSKLAAPAADNGGKTIPDGAPAEAKDHAADDLELEAHSDDALDGKTIPDGARDALRPKSQKWGASAAKGLILPKHLAKIMLPEAFAIGGKALPITSIGTSGGYITPREFQAELLRYQAEEPALFPNVRQVPTITGKVDWPRLAQGATDQYGGVVCTWTAEGAAKTDTEPTIEQVQVDAYELSAYTEVTRALSNRSAIPIQQLIQELFRTSLLGYLDAAILSGNGSSKPLGILDAASGIGSVARAVALQVSREDLINMKHELPLGARRGPCGFIVSDAAMEYLEKATNALGLPVHPVNPATGKLDTLVGKPILGVFSSGTLGTAGDVIYGDPKQYIAAVDQEIVFASSDQYQFKSGRIAYVIFMLVGGKPAVPQAFVKLSDAA